MWLCYQFDLPEHGERTDGKDRRDIWNGIHDLNAIADYVFLKWNHVFLYACSLGAYFSLHTYSERVIQKFARKYRCDLTISQDSEHAFMQDVGIALDPEYVGKGYGKHWHYPAVLHINMQKREQIYGMENLINWRFTIKK